jgi:hypothetical protein
MSETQATDCIQEGHDQDHEMPTENGEEFGWLDLKTGPLPFLAPPGWETPVGLPIPMPPPVTRPAASGLSTIAGELSSLPTGWHSLPSERFGVGGSGFEHIVIGPAGVFTVTTTGGSEGRGIDRHLRNAHFQAERATRLLDQAGLVDIHVQAAIVSVGAEPAIQDHADVVVAPIHDICRSLMSQPTTLTPLQIQAVYNIAARRDTWIERPQPKG